MSLVAYAASDDSETSDVEESEAPQLMKAGDSNDPAVVDDGKISDEDDYVPTTSTSTGTSASDRGSRPSQASAGQNAVSTSSTNNTGLHSVPIPTTLSDLPAPKAASSSQGGGDKEDELEEEVKPKASQLADAPKPPPKKVKQPTRIVLPALKKDSDDEDEESGKKTKTVKATESSVSLRSGLFALLPPPAHTSRKQTNRPLIPYTLTKRPAASKPTPAPAKPKAKTTTTAAAATTADTDLLPSQKHQSAFNALTGYESDSDEEAENIRSNFFSIGSEADATSSSSSGLSVVKNSAPSFHQMEGDSLRTSNNISKDSSNVPSSSSQTKQTHSVSVISESPVSSSSSSVSVSTSGNFGNVALQKTEDSEDGDGDDGDNENEVSSTVGVPLINQDAPLNFSGAMGGASWSTAPLTSPMLPEMYAAQASSSGASYWQQHEHYAQDFGEDTEQEASSSGSNIQQYMEDEQFLRISGKRKRGQEDIQIIDANVDDYVDPSELVKGITEETSYQPHRKKENMPSVQQRRKKQITYLAFQAKERELELKNAWSQNRMTKNQTRSKYGF